MTSISGTAPVAVQPQKMELPVSVIRLPQALATSPAGVTLRAEVIAQGQDGLTVLLTDAGRVEVRTNQALLAGLGILLRLLPGQPGPPDDRRAVLKLPVSTDRSSGTPGGVSGSKGFEPSTPPARDASPSAARSTLSPIQNGPLATPFKVGLVLSGQITGAPLSGVTNSGPADPGIQQLVPGRQVTAQIAQIAAPGTTFPEEAPTAAGKAATASPVTKQDAPVPQTKDGNKGSRTPTGKAATATATPTTAPTTASAAQPPRENAVQRPVTEGAVRTPGTVISPAVAKNLVIQTPAGRLVLQPVQTPPAIGSRVLLDILPRPGSSEGVQAGHKFSQAPASETISQLRAVLALAALPSGPVIQPALPPAPGPGLAGNLVLFLIAAQFGDLSRWLGRPAADLLQNTAGRGDLLGRLTEEIIRPPISHENGSDWRSFVIPIVGEPPGDRLLWRYRQHKDSDADDEGDPLGTRILVDLHLSRLGAMQIDGLYRRTSLDLVLRSGNPLGTVFEGEVRHLFEDACARSGIVGGITFAAGQPFTVIDGEDLLMVNA